MNTNKLKLFALAALSLFTCKNISAQTVEYVSQNNKEFATTIAKPKVQLVDARTAAEYAQGHIKNAVNIDVNSADFNKLAGSSLSKKNPVAVYCRSGKRSKNAANRLTGLGFSPVYDLDKGLLNWDGGLVK